jgi:hypothetical protein
MEFRRSREYDYSTIKFQIKNPKSQFIYTLEFLVLEFYSRCTFVKSNAGLQIAIYSQGSSNGLEY